MITLKDYFRAVDYRITEGSEYGWACYGPDAYCLEAVLDSTCETSAGVIFDRKTQTVYDVSLCLPNDVCYRWLNPEYDTKYYKECAERGYEPDIAYDTVRYKDTLSSLEMLCVIQQAFNTGQSIQGG